MDDAEVIWNRATDPTYSPSKPGDVALHAVLAFHSLSMNGGITDPLETDFGLSKAAEQAFRRLGADHLADLVNEARALAMPAVAEDGSFNALDLGQEDAEALEALDERLPDDSEVEAIFRTYLAAHPDEFDPPAGRLRIS